MESRELMLNCPERCAGPRPGLLRAAAWSSAVGVTQVVDTDRLHTFDCRSLHVATKCRGAPGRGQGWRKPGTTGWCREPWGSAGPGLGPQRPRAVLAGLWKETSAFTKTGQLFHLLPTFLAVPHPRMNFFLNIMVILVKKSTSASNIYFALGQKAPNTWSWVNREQNKMSQKTLNTQTPA